MVEEGSATIKYGDLDIVQVYLRGKDKVLYRKNKPQSDAIWLGLGVRDDLKDTHMYLFQEGLEINKQFYRIDVPPTYLITEKVNQDQELRMYWPLAAGSCACTAVFQGDHLDLDISNENNERIISPSKPSTIYAVFVDKNNMPIPPGKIRIIEKSDPPASSR